VGVPRFPPLKPGSPPPDPTTVLRQVQADLAQLAAIQDYAPARAAVANGQHAVVLANSTLYTALSAQAQAQGAQRAAQNHLDVAAARVRDLAVAAYMGLGFLTPAAGPQQVQESQTGTVSSPGGLTGSAAMDTMEMLRVVAQHERHDLQASHVALRDAGHAIDAAAQQVAAARSSVAAAQSVLAASNQTLTLVIKAATTPGLAARLNLPGLPGRAGLTGLAGLAGGPAPPTGSTLPSGGAAPGGAASGGTAPGGTAPGDTALGGTAPGGTAPGGTAPGSTSSTAAAVNPIGRPGAALQPTPPPSPSILGPSVLSSREMAGWFASTGRKAHTTVTMAQLANDYALAGQQTDVRADLAFAQSLIETGYFSFPAGGQLTPKDNNFAGIGACDSCAHGWSFPDALTGVTAQLQLLDAYASPVQVPTNLVGNVGVGGCCPTWMELAGTWASNVQYGIAIMTIYHHMLAWAIPPRLVAAGLLAPPRPPPGHGPPSAGTQTGTGAGTDAGAGAGTGAGGSAGDGEGANAAGGAPAGPTVVSLPLQSAVAAQVVQPAQPAAVRGGPAAAQP
jgi:hypothetical protein